MHGKLDNVCCVGTVLFLTLAMIFLTHSPFVVIHTCLIVYDQSLAPCFKHVGKTLLEIILVAVFRILHAF